MPTEQTAGEAVLVDRHEYDDRTVFAFDYGPGVEAAVDVVGDTAIVVAGDDQREVDLPDGAVEAFNRNGVVTIEVRE